MLKAMQRRLQGQRESGFTLIELMVVVLIIAILIAIAIPTFLGARQRAQNRAAQSSLRNALTAAKTIYTDREDFAQATAAALGGVEPSLTFNAAAAASTSPRMVSVSPGVSPSTVFYAAALSASNTCYMIRDVAVTGALPAGTAYASTAAGACTGQAAAALAAASWTTSW